MQTMEIKKAHFAVGEDTVQLSMPFAKVNKETRTVSGWATLDSLDTQGDVLTAGASRAAFESFRGNVRFMHKSDSPVGKILKFEEKPFYNAADDSWYNGIYVDVYVSKGAQNVWEMVLDGTLTGFSIGGALTDAESTFVKNKDGVGGRTVRFVKAYMLTELSLVDSPANPMASITSFQKMFTFKKGEDGVTEVTAEDAPEHTFVHYCTTDSVAVASSTEVEKCNICASDMEVIGAFESLSEGREEKIAGIVRKYLAPANDEGGVLQKMADNDNVTVDNAEETTTEENGEVTVDPSEAVEVEEAETEAQEVSEVEQETDLTKVLESLKNDITKAVEASAEKNAEQVESLSKQLAEVNTQVEERLVKFQQELDAQVEKFSGLEESLNKVQGSLSALEDETAVKKSSDLGGSEEKLEKNKKESSWGGRFFSVEQL